MKILFLIVFAATSALGNDLAKGSAARLDFNAQNLNCHNKYRSNHRVPPLQYDNKLMASAQQYADTLAARDQGLVHQPGPDYGENLYFTYGQNFNGFSACNMWYDENKQYNYNNRNPSNFYQVGHFTQMVWKGSKSIGIGVATSRSGKTYIVARYSPPGNYMGMYKENVLVPQYS